MLAACGQINHVLLERFKPEIQQPQLCFYSFAVCSGTVSRFALRCMESRYIWAAAALFLAPRVLCHFDVNPYLYWTLTDAEYRVHVMPALPMPFSRRIKFLYEDATVLL